MSRLLLVAAFKAAILSQFGPELQFLGTLFLVAGIIAGLVKARWLVWSPVVLKLGPPPVTRIPPGKSQAVRKRAA